MVSIQSRCFAPRRVPQGGLAAAALAACLLAWGGASASSPPREIVVVTDINYPPYLFQTEGGRLQGIVKDKWALWSKRTGIPVRVEGMEWAKAQESVQEGTADVIEALTYTPWRSRSYEYSQAYAPVEARIYFHRTISGINDVESLRGFTVGAKEGSACGSWLMERDIDVFGYPTSEMLVKAAGAGEVRLFCMDSPAARYFLLKHQLADQFRESPPLYTSNFHWAVRKGRTELRDFIQTSFAGITEKELKDIDARWLGTPLRFHIPERYYYYLALLAAAVLGSYALLVAWNRTLKSRVSAKTAELSAALESVQTHADKVRDLYNNAPCGYHSLDKEGTIVEINDTELAWLGYTRKDVIGKLKFTDLLTEEGRGAFREKFDDFKRLGSVRDLEYELIRKDGTKMSVLVSASLIRDAQGKYVMSRGTLYDMTEHNRARLALKESEERFGRIFRLSPDAIMVSSVAEGRVIDVNEAMLGILDRTREEVIGRTTMEIGFWGNLRERAQALENLRGQQGGVQQFERAIHTPAGRVKDTVVTTTPIELQSEQVLLSIIQDVTEKRRAEHLLRQSEERFQRIFNNSPYPMTMTRLADLKIIEANEAALTLFGFSREEVAGKTSAELNVWGRTEDRGRFIKLLEERKELRDLEAPLRDRLGNLKDMLISAQVIELKGEEFAITTLVDISERKRSERLLEESERRLSRVIEASPEAITIASLEDGSFVEVNPAGERLCGYKREEMIGRSAEDLRLWGNPEERERIVEDLRRHEEVHGREIRLRCKNGEMRDILASAATIDLKGKRYMLFQGVDITEQKAAEKALRRQELVLRELSAHHDAVREGERAHIAREVHDELGQSLTALKMELSLLDMKFGEAAPQIREPVQELKKRVDAIIQLVRDVATALRPAALDLGILPGVEWLVGEFRKRSGIQCTVSVTGSEIVLSDERSIVLFRILQESLTNISRHGNARKVEVLLDHDAEQIRLDVQDDGDGFDVEAARGRKTFGLLGMRERAIMLQGDMSITSSPGRGTRVSVSLQIA